MSLLVKIGRVLCFLLGVLEFFSAVRFFYSGEEIVTTAERLTPPIIGSDRSARVVFCTYLITLGFQRLSWALGEGGLIAWLLLLGTHLVEWFMWCYFALLPRFRGDSSFQELIQEVISLQSIGGPHALVVLILLPILIVFFLLIGPTRFQINNKSKMP